jgi:hypothetical protein
MTRLHTLAAVTFAATLAGCATMSVSSHVQPNLNMSAYRTFDWGPADSLPTGDPRFDKDPFFQDHMLGQVERHMAARGLAHADDASQADLLIHYHAAIQTRMDVNRVDRTYGYCYDEACSTRVIEYEAGTLVLDIVDRKTNRLIWRGWAQDSVDKMLKDRDHMAAEIARAVDGMFERFPGAF